MSTARWEQVKSLFHAAMELPAPPAPDRAAFLETQCKGDAALRQEVESLLKTASSAVVKTGGAAHALGLDETAGLGGKTRSTMTHVAPITETAGTVIGPYKLLQVIGEGGFGTVFLAEQYQPVRRRVALKIIKLGMDTKSVVARFEAERQALALMDHPHIARVLDGGATDTGRPYFVMEYVVGDSITKFADAHSLTVNERLDLFQQVCSAVQHAHTKGIIHRDLKPGNVLVSMVDGKPFAKVIDFGIAKATAGVGGALTDKTLFTEHKLLIGTPEYMSPEQAEGSMDIDTRTDVYSLGVLLYELLTGTTPIDSTKLRSAAYDEMRRMIREDDPPMPSMKLSRSLDKLAATAAARKVEPSKLSTIVKGELDWIVMKALEKERSRRYETANALGDDVRRHLLGEAVIAAPVSRVYQLKKFVRKHKWPAGMVAILLVGFAGTSIGFGVAQYNATAAKRNLNVAIQAKDFAESSAYRASLSLAQSALNERDFAARQVIEETPERLRGWEWHFLNRRANSVLWSVRGNYRGVRFSPDGAFVAALEGTSDVRTWHTADGADFQRFSNVFDGSASFTISPDSKKIGVLSMTRCRAWDVSSGNTLIDIQSPGDAEDTYLITGSAPSLVFGPDGNSLVTTSWSNVASMWSIWSGSQVHTFDGHKSNVVAALFDGSGTRLATASNDGTVRIWNITDRSSLHQFKISTGFVHDIEWSKDDSQLIARDIRGIAAVLDTRNGEVIRTFGSDREYISACTFGPQRGQVFTVSGHRVKLWQLSSEKTIRQYYCSSGITQLVCSPSGDQFLTVEEGGRVSRWDSITGCFLGNLPTPEANLAEVCYSPDGKLIACRSDQMSEVSYGAFFGGGSVVTIMSSTSVGDAESIVDNVDTTQIEVLSRIAATTLHGSLDNRPVESVATKDGTRRIELLKKSGKVQPKILSFVACGSSSERELAQLSLSDSAKNLDLVNHDQQLVITLNDGSVCIWDIRDPAERRKDLEREWTERVPANEYLDGLWNTPPETLPTDSIREKIIADTSLTPLRRLVAVEMLEERLEDTRVAVADAFGKIVQQAEEETQAWQAIDTVRMKSMVVSAANAAEFPPRVKDQIKQKAAVWQYETPVVSESERANDATAFAECGTFDAGSDNSDKLASVFRPLTAPAIRHMSRFQGPWILHFVGLAEGQAEYVSESLKLLADSNSPKVHPRAVWLTGTQLTDAGLAALANNNRICEALTDLGIGENSITDSGLELLTRADSRLKALTSLDISGTQVTDAGIKNLARSNTGLSALISLDVSDTQVTDAAVKSLARSDTGLKSLDMLSVEGTQITDTGVKDIARIDTGLSSLTWLSLAKTKVTDAGLLELAKPDTGLKALASLNISDTQITDVGIKELARPDTGLKALVELNISNTQVTDEAVAVVEARWPGIKVIR